MPRIVFDPMLLQNRQKLRLEIALPMVLLLTGYVRHRRVHL
jgi:hypothetical protein